MPSFNLFSNQIINITNEQAAVALLKIYDTFILEVIETYRSAYNEEHSEVKGRKIYQFEKNSKSFEIPSLKETFFNNGFVVIDTKNENPKKSKRAVISIKNFSTLPILEFPENSKRSTNLTVKEILSALPIEIFHLISKEIPSSFPIETFHLKPEESTVKEIIETRLTKFFENKEIANDRATDIHNEDKQCNRFVNRKDIITLFIDTLSYFVNSEIKAFLQEQWLPELLIKCSAIAPMYKDENPEIVHSLDVIQHLYENFPDEINQINDNSARLTESFINYLTIKPGFLRCLDNEKVCQIIPSLITAARIPNLDGNILENKSLINEQDLIDYQEKIITALLESFIKIKDDKRIVSLAFYDFFTIKSIDEIEDNENSDSYDSTYMQLHGLENTLLNLNLNEKRYGVKLKIEINNFLLSLIDNIPNNISAVQYIDITSNYILKLTAEALENQNSLEEYQQILQNTLFFFYQHESLQKHSIFSHLFFALYLLDENFFIKNCIEKPMEIEEIEEIEESEESEKSDADSFVGSYPAVSTQESQINYHSLIMKIGSSFEGLKELFLTIEKLSNQSTSLEIKAQGNRYKNLLLELFFIENDSQSIVFSDSFKKIIQIEEGFQILQDLIKNLDFNQESSEIFTEALVNHLHKTFSNSKNLNYHYKILAELINFALITPCTLSTTIAKKSKTICQEFSRQNNVDSNKFVTFSLNYLIEDVSKIESEIFKAIQEANFFIIFNNLIVCDSINDIDNSSSIKDLLVAPSLYSVNEANEITALIELLEKITQAKKALYSQRKPIDKNDFNKAINYLSYIYQGLYENHSKSLKKLLSNLTNHSQSNNLINESLLRLMNDIALNLPESVLELRNIIGYHLPFTKNEINLIKQDAEFLFNYVLIPTLKTEQRKALIKLIFTSNGLTATGLKLFERMQLTLIENENQLDSPEYLKIKNSIEDFYRNLSTEQRGELFKSVAYALTEIRNEIAILHNKDIDKKKKKNVYNAIGKKTEDKRDNSQQCNELTAKLSLIKNNFIFLLNQVGSINTHPILIDEEEINSIDQLLTLMLQNFPERLGMIFNNMMDKNKIAEKEVTTDHIIQAFIAFNNPLLFATNIHILQMILKRFGSKINEQDALVLLTLIDDFLIEIIERPKFDNTDLIREQAAEANEIREILLRKILTINDLSKQLSKNNLTKIVKIQLQKNHPIIKDSNPHAIGNVFEENTALANFRNRIMFKYLKNNQKLNTIYIDSTVRLNLLVGEKFDELSRSQQTKLINTLIHNSENSFLATDFNKLFKFTNRLSNVVANTLINYYDLLLTEENFAMIESEEAKATLFLAVYNNLNAIPFEKRQQIEKNLDKIARNNPKIIACLLSLPLAHDNHHLFTNQQIKKFSKSKFINYLIMPESNEFSRDSNVIQPNSFFLTTRKQTELFRNLMIEGDLEDAIAKNIVDNLAKNDYLLVTDIISIFIERAMLNKPLSKSMAKYLMKQVMTGEKTDEKWLQFANFSHYLETEAFTKHYKNCLFESYINRYQKFKGGKAIIENYSHPLARQKAFASMLYEQEIKTNPELIAQLQVEINNDGTIKDNNILNNDDKAEIKEIYLKATKQVLEHEIVILVKQQMELKSIEINQENFQAFITNKENTLLINNEEISIADYIANYKANILANLKHYQKVNSHQIKSFLPKDRQYSYVDYRYLTSEEEGNELKQALIEHYLNHRMLDVFAKAKETIFLTAHDADKENLTVRLGMKPNRVNIKHITEKDYLKLNHGKVMNQIDEEAYSELSGDTIKENLENKIAAKNQRFTGDYTSNRTLTASGYFLKGDTFNEKKLSLKKGFQHWRAKTEDGSEFQTLSMHYDSARDTYIIDSRKKLELDLQRGTEELPTIDIKFYQLHRYIILAFRKMFNAIAKKLASKAEPISSEEENTSASSNNKFIKWGKNNQSPAFTMEDLNGEKIPVTVDYNCINENLFAPEKESSTQKEKIIYSPLFVSSKTHKEYVDKKNKYENKENKEKLFKEAYSFQNQALPGIY